MSQSTVQQDFAIIDFAANLSSYGSFGIETNYSGGTVHLTGYPATAGGLQTDQVGTVSADPNYSVLDYGSLISVPGNSGGPVWIDLGTSTNPLPYVVGVASTTGWAAQLTPADFQTIQSWENADTSLWTVTATTDDGAKEVGIGHVITLTLNTIAAETVTGAPSLQLNDNEVASYVGGSGTTALQFAYTVQPGDNTSDLQVTGVNLPNGATIHDASGDVPSTAVTADLGIQVITLVTNLQSNEDHLVYLMYQASFARIPDYAGFEYWAGQADAQQFSALQLADIFMAALEFTAKFGVNPTNSAYVTELYTNVLGRAPDPAGLAYWIGQANAGQARDQLLVDFAVSAENLQTTGPHTAHGYWVT